VLLHLCRSSPWVTYFGENRNILSKNERSVSFMTLGAGSLQTDGGNKFVVQNGVVTAGSASGICDGAAAVIIAR
jgi:hypothetical protein